jgi:hypothetical protein
MGLVVPELPSVPVHMNDVPAKLEFKLMVKDDASASVGPEHME